MTGRGKRDEWGQRRDGRKREGLSREPYGKKGVGGLSEKQ